MEGIIPFDLFGRWEHTDDLAGGSPRSSEPSPFGILDGAEVAPVVGREILRRGTCGSEKDAVREGADPRVL
jgi:hypothetical protein